MSLRARRQIAVAVLGILLVWPLAHRALVATLGLDPWRFFGFAMYCVPKPHIAVDMYGLQPLSVRKMPVARESPAYRAVKIFALMRTAWGRRHEPDEFAEAFLEEHPGLERLRVVVLERRLDRSTAHIAVDRYEYEYRRLSTAASTARVDPLARPP